MLKYVDVSIDRSETTKLVVRVVPWEAPVLALVNGPESCKEIGSEFIAKKAKPDATAEYARLYERYRSAGGPRAVEVFYGPPMTGVPKIQAAIDAAWREGDSAEVATAAVEAGDVGGMTAEEQQSLMADLGLPPTPAPGAGVEAIAE